MQRMTASNSWHAAKARRFAQRAPVQPLMPEPQNPPIELPQTAAIRRPAVLLVLASERGVEHRLRRDWVVPMLPPPSLLSRSAEDVYAWPGHESSTSPAAACANVR